MNYSGLQIGITVSFLKSPSGGFRGLLLFALLLSGCGEERSGGTVPAPAAGPDQTFLSARFVVTENGLTSAVIRADSVLVWQEREVSEMNGNLKVDFFSREGIRVSTLTADRGIVYGIVEVLDSLRADGDVIVVWHERSAVLKTPFMRWIARSRMIYADSTVALSVENASERGVGFAAPDDLKSYTMRAVTGFVQDESIRIPRIGEEK